MFASFVSWNTTTNMYIVQHPALDFIIIIYHLFISDYKNPYMNMIKLVS